MDKGMLVLVLILLIDEDAGGRLVPVLAMDEVMNESSDV